MDSDRHTRQHRTTLKVQFSLYLVRLEPIKKFSLLTPRSVTDVKTQSKWKPIWRVQIEHQVPCLTCMLHYLPT